MGEWSPECVACRWADGVDGPAIGATFSGDNVAKAGPVTLKRWTTSSEITGYEPDELFEFIAEGYSTWRYEFEASADTTRDELDQWRVVDNQVVSCSGVAPVEPARPLHLEVCVFGDNAHALGWASR